MGSMSNPNPWSPYDSYNDCSQGICNIYCPQWCYLVFPPPPPSFFLDDGDDSSSSSSSNFSPLLIALIGILVSAFVLVSYYTLISKYCHRRGQETPSSETPPRRDRGGVVAARQGISNAAADGDGLNDSLIKSITVYKYRKGDGFVDGSDCSVCLSEFEENESLRLLPKCNHAFHLPCIDTWLKSHSNCPLCRAFVTGTNPTTEPDRIATESEVSTNQHQIGDSAIVIEDLETQSRNSNARLQSQPPEEQRDEKDEDQLPIRRSVSLNSGTVVSIADVLREIEEGDEASGVGTSETKTETEANQRSGVSSFLVRNTVAMKRSVSTGRFILSRYDRTRNYRLPN